MGAGKGQSCSYSGGVYCLRSLGVLYVIYFFRCLEKKVDQGKLL